MEGRFLIETVSSWKTLCNTASRNPTPQPAQGSRFNVSNPFRFWTLNFELLNRALPRERGLRADLAEEVVAFIVDQDKRRKIFHVNLPDRFHT